MNRTWITGLTLAGVAGSGGAFAGAAASSNDAPAAAQAPAVVQASQFAQAAAQTQGRTVTYQVGAAGTVTLTVANGVLTVVGAAPGTGWTVAPTIAVGTHVEVQYTDMMQLVTFGADLVNNEVAVVLTNVPAPGAIAPAAPAPMDISVVQPAAGSGRAVSKPRAATPQPAATQPATTQQPPRPSATTAPSGSGVGSNTGNDHEEPGDD